MPHAARHSRPHVRRQEEAHALGSLLDTLHSASELVPPVTARRHLQPEYTAPPSPLPLTSAHIHATSVGLSTEDEELIGRQHAEQQATTSARTTAQPHPPPETSPAAPPASAGNGAGGVNDDAASSNAQMEMLRAMELLEVHKIGVAGQNDFVMPLISRLSLIQHDLAQSVQTSSMRRTAGRW